MAIGFLALLPPLTLCALRKPTKRINNCSRPMPIAFHPARASSRYDILYSTSSSGKQRKAWKDGTLVVDERRAVVLSISDGRPVWSQQSSGSSPPALFRELLTRTTRSLDEGEELQLGPACRIQVIRVMHNALLPWDSCTDVAAPPVQSAPRAELTADSFCVQRSTDYRVRFCPCGPRNSPDYVLQALEEFLCSSMAHGQT